MTPKYTSNQTNKKLDLDKYLTSIEKEKSEGDSLKDDEITNARERDIRKKIQTIMRERYTYY